MFLGGQVGPDAHVEHHDFPLSVAIKGGRPDVMAVAAILRPQLRSTCFGRASSRSERLLRGRGSRRGLRSGRGTSAGEKKSRDGGDGQQGRYEPGDFRFHKCISPVVKSREQIE